MLKLHKQNQAKRYKNIFMHFINNIYTFEDFISKSIKEDPFHPDGHKFMLELYKNKHLITVPNKEIDLYINSQTMYIGYIGFDKQYRGGTLKELHTHCLNVLQNSIINKVVLKPLTNVLTMWIYFGFTFEKSYEAIRARLTMINYLKSKSIINENDIPKYAKMTLMEIVNTFKNDFKEAEFPLIVEKELYYTTLKKDI